MAKSYFKFKGKKYSSAGQLGKAVNRSMENTMKKAIKKHLQKLKKI